MSEGTVRRCLSLACLSLLLAAGGCAEPPMEVSVNQPIDFQHGSHLNYFASGKHRTEGIKVHLEVVDANDLPPELTEGRCAECHEDAEMLACAGCHVRLENAALRGQKEVRKCVGCHRGAWGASAATIPSATACLACHKDGVELTRAGTNGPPRAISAGYAPPVNRLVEDVPWMRINTMPPNVYFSHTAHVRYASMACTRCHEDVTALRSPPSLVRVFTMSECLTCHVENGGRTDCLTCHK